MADELVKVEERKSTLLTQCGDKLKASKAKKDTAPQSLLNHMLMPSFRCRLMTMSS